MVNKMNSSKEMLIEKLNNAGFDFIDYIDKHENVMKIQSKVDTEEHRVAKTINTISAGLYEKLCEADIRGVPKIFDIIKDEDIVIVIEEYIEGKTLDRMIDEESSYLRNISNIEKIVSDLLDILEKLGNLNPPIIHRDIKPGNIMFDSEKNLYLLDFNISREHDGSKIRDTFAMGTRGFAAPEQYGFSESDIRTDFYGLGATIKYLLKNVIFYQTFLPDMERLDTLNEFTEKCMKMDKEDRFQSVKEIRYFLGYTSGKNSAGVKGIKKGKGSFAIPGFRSKNPIYMFIAVSCYIISAFLSVTAMFSDTNSFEGLSKDKTFVLNVFSSIITYGICIFVIFFIMNYRGIHSWFRFTRKKCSGVEHKLRIMLWALFLFIVLLFTEALIMVTVSRLI